MFFGIMLWTLLLSKKTYFADVVFGVGMLACLEMAAELGIFAVWLNG